MGIMSDVKNNSDNDVVSKLRNGSFNNEAAFMNSQASTGVPMMENVTSFNNSYESMEDTIKYTPKPVESNTTETTASNTEFIPLSESGFVSFGNSIPQVEVPVTTMPQVEIPVTAMPQVEIPTSAMPQVEIPTSAMPQSTMSSSGMPEFAMPEFTRPEFTRPEFMRPEDTIPNAEPKQEEPVVALEPELDVEVEMTTATDTGYAANTADAAGSEEGAEAMEQNPLEMIATEVEAEVATTAETVENQEVAATTEAVENQSSDESTETVENQEASKSVEELLGELITKVDGLDSEFKSKIANDATKTNLVNRMSDELDVYKEGMMMKLYKPIVKDIIEVMSDLRRLSNDYSKKLAAGEEIQMERVIKNLRLFESDLCDVLERYDVEAYTEESDTFNMRTQTAVKTIDTDNPELHKKIESRVMDGFRMGDKILERERVNAYRYVKPKEDQNA